MGIVISKCMFKKGCKDYRLQVINMDLCCQHVHLRWLPSAFWAVLFGFYSFFRAAECRWLSERNYNYLAFPLSYLQQTVGGKRRKKEKQTCQMCLEHVNVRQTATNVDILALRRWLWLGSKWWNVNILHFLLVKYLL